MNEILDKLFVGYAANAAKSEYIRELETEIVSNKKRLKQSLSKRQKKFLLRLEDGKDMLIEKTSAESFVAGFKLGLKVGYEVNAD